jgi:hypothetical protein
MTPAHVFGPVSPRKTVQARDSFDEVFMAGRRSHPRYGMVTPWEGAVRVLKEVVVDMLGTNELVAVSHSPGVIGDEMFLDLVGEGRNVEVRVRVTDSQPVIVGGAVRYRLRLVLASPAEESDAEVPSGLNALPEPEVS